MKPLKFRRLFSSLSSGGILVPYLEQELLIRGERVWPESYVIPIVNKERRWDGYFHPSSHAAMPEMELYYLFHPEIRVQRDPLTVENIMTFQVGSAFHALIQSMLIHLGMTSPEECEVKFVNKEYWCSGALDIRKLTLPSGVFPVEIKSAGYLPKEPPLAYLQQFQIYMDIGCEQPQEQGIMLFLEKSNPHRFREFMITRNPGMLRSIYQKWNRVREAIEFSDPSMLEFPCHELDSKAHKECPARFICPLGPPTGQRLPIS